MGGTSVIEWGRERVRAGPWRGEPSVAYLNPIPGSPMPSPDFVSRCLRRLAREGFTRVVTGALSAGEQSPFRACGFAVAEDLYLLAHDLSPLPPGALSAETITTRRGTRRDRPSVLAVDTLAFEPFWRLDDGGLDEAISATPHARFRIAIDAEAGEEIVGYAVTGRAGRRGYLQRLAVHPERQRQGIGRLLVDDAFRWLRRWRVERVMVNTQRTNAGALALYEHLGFRREPSGLSVLAIDL